MPAFQFEIEGLAGLALQYGQETSPRKSFSIVSCVGEMMAQAGPGFFDGLGMFLLTVLYIMCTFILPWVQLIMLGVMWMQPLTLKRMKQLMLAIDVVSTWAALDVAVISILASMLEIGRLSTFFIKDKCDDIYPFTKGFLQKLGLLPSPPHTGFL